MPGDADRLRVWVHPTWRLMGGEYDPETGRVTREGEWAERVRRTLDDPDEDAVAVALRVDREEAQRFEDGDAPTRVSGPHTDLPPGEGWDRVVEDASGRGELPRETVADLVSGYEEVAVCGGYVTGCQRRFAETAAEVADGPDVRVVGRDSYRHDGFDPVGSDRPHDRRLEEQAAAEAPPDATTVLEKVEAAYADLDVEIDAESPERER